MREIIEGDRLDRYDLIELLARSGMASIFKAVDRESGTTVALKIPHMQFESDVAFFERFKREEQIGQKLEHPNIVRVLTVGPKSRMYLVMEFAEGRSLRAVTREHKGMPVAQALDIARQICSALVYMHAEGVVHRDLKPDNVLLGNDGKVKLLDFGIAMDESARRLTWFGLSPPMGTPDYMAPEQVRGRRGDARTDLYALGTMLYEMLCGELPYAAGNVHATMRKKLNEDAAPIRDRMPDLDPKIAEIVMRSIERSPRERYASAKDMLADLEDPSRVVPRDRSREASATPLLLRLSVPRPWIWPTALAVVMLALLALIWKTGRQRAQPTTHTARAAAAAGAASMDAGGE